MYSLITFYLAMRKELVPYQPFLKFLCIKLVIFFTFWQSVVLGLLGHFGVIKPTEYWSVTNIATGVQAIVVCFEMIIFSILHIRAYPYNIYRPSDRIKLRRWWRGFVDALNPFDLIKEIYHGIRWMFTREPWNKNEHWEKVQYGEDEVETEAEAVVRRGHEGRVEFLGAATVDLAKLIGVDEGEQARQEVNAAMEAGTMTEQKSQSIAQGGIAGRRST